MGFGAPPPKPNFLSPPYSHEGRGTTSSGDWNNIHVGVYVAIQGLQYKYLVLLGKVLSSVTVLKCFNLVDDLVLPFIYGQP
jgi:hypothetical protein